MGSTPMQPYILEFSYDEDHWRSQSFLLTRMLAIKASGLGEDEPGKVCLWFCFTFSLSPFKGSHYFFDPTSNCKLTFHFYRIFFLEGITVGNRL